MSILFFISAFISEVIGTMAGFGSSTIFLPLSLLFVDFRTALVLVTFFHIFGNVGRISFFRQGIDIGLLIKFGIPSIILTVIGALLVHQMPQDLFKRILGAFLIIYASYSLWKDKLSIPASTTNAVIGGSLSGFLTGLIGTGGALRGAFLTGFRLPKAKYLATTAAIALVVDITRIPIYLSGGLFDKEYSWYLPVLFAVALSGSFVGKMILNKISQNYYKKFVLIALLVIGAKFILK